MVPCQQNYIHAHYKLHRTKLAALVTQVKAEFSTILEHEIQRSEKNKLQ